MGRVLVIVFALAGVFSLISVFTRSPGVGHFRTLAGRAAYLESYQRAFELLPEPTAQYDIPTDLGMVRVYEWSNAHTADAIPVVLVPGRSSGVPMWSENLPGFIESHRVIAFDALGDAGLSVQAAPMTSFEDQAKWIDPVLQRLAPEGAHLVGHSFGGATATVYARLHPERVRTLTLLEPVFTFGYPRADLMSWVLLASIPVLPQSWREYALGKVGGEPYDSGSADPMAAMIRDGSEYYSAELPTPSPLTAEQVASLTMPVYLALAGRDSFAGQDAARQAEKLLPAVQVETWPQATHSLPMQEAGPLAERLQKFWAAAG